MTDKPLNLEDLVKQVEDEDKIIVLALEMFIRKNRWSDDKELAKALKLYAMLRDPNNTFYINVRRVKQ